MQCSVENIANLIAKKPKVRKNLPNDCVLLKNMGASSFEQFRSHFQPAILTVTV